MKQTLLKQGASFFLDCYLDVITEFIKLSTPTRFTQLRNIFQKNIEFIFC